MSDKHISDWWHTAITDIEPGSIRLRGYSIEDLIGNVSFPSMIWLMLRGDLPSKGEAALLESALVAAVDHGPHAPSIAVARMAVTCGLDLNGAVATGVNVLDDVHGGAGQQCMQFFQDISDLWAEGRTLEEAVRQGIDDYIEQHGKYIPGFGHRFHRAKDPRFERLMEQVQIARRAGAVSGRYREIGMGVAAELERRRGEPLPMNIDGSTAVVYSELGFPPQLGRGLFVLSRSVDILAHSWEQIQQGERIKGPIPRDIAVTYEGPPPRGVVDRG